MWAQRVPVMKEGWPDRRLNTKTVVGTVGTQMYECIEFFLEPWSMHCVATFLFMFLFRLAPLLCCIGAMFLVGWSCVVMTRERTNPMQDNKWLGIGLLMLASTILGTIEGYDGYINYTGQYYSALDGRVYHEVEPTELAESKTDAGEIFWAPDTIVDVTRASGLVVKDTFCVAPIANSNDLTGNVEFWAVGKNCCRFRSSFDCDDAGVPTDTPQSIAYYTYGGMFGNMTSSDTHFYKLAVEQAKADFGILSSGEVKLVHWTHDVEATKSSYLWASVWFYIGHSIWNLLINILMGSVVFLYTKSKQQQNEERAHALATAI